MKTDCLPCKITKNTFLFSSASYLIYHAIPFNRNRLGPTFNRNRLVPTFNRNRLGPRDRGFIAILGLAMAGLTGFEIRKDFHSYQEQKCIQST